MVDMLLKQTKPNNSVIFNYLLVRDPHRLKISQLAGAVEYDTKQSDGEVPVMLELWGMQSTPSLPGPLWLRVVAPNRAPCTNTKLNYLK